MGLDATLALAAVAGESGRPETRVLVVAPVGDRSATAHATNNTPSSTRPAEKTPLVVGVRGLVLGCDFPLLIDADLVVAATDLSLCDRTAEGAPPTRAVTELAQRYKFGDVMRLLLLGSRASIDAQRALELGIVDELAERENLTERCISLASTLASVDVPDT